MTRHRHRARVIVAVVAILAEATLAACGHGTKHASAPTGAAPSPGGGGQQSGPIGDTIGSGPGGGPQGTASPGGGSAPGPGNVGQSIQALLPGGSTPATLGQAAPGVATSGAPVAVQSGAGPARQVASYVLGFNGENIRNQSAVWSDPGFLGAVGGLAPETIRVFGGTTANYWDWRTGTFAATASQAPDIVQGGPNPPIPLTQFATDLRAAHAIPVFDLNMVTSTLQDQLAMLHEAQKLGMKVRLVELGNELYLNRADDVSAFPTGADYGRTATQWIAAIKSAFPGVRVAAVGFDASMVRGPRRWFTWNAQMLSTLRGEDAITFHTYWNVATTPADLAASPEGAAAVFDAAASEASTVIAKDLSILPAGVTAWITEWNLNSGSKQLGGTWAQGLSMISYALRLLGDDRVELLDNHALVGDNSFAALTTTTGFAPSSDGVTLGMLLRAVRGATTASPLTFGAGQDLVGSVFSGDRGTATVVVNLGPATVQLTLAQPASRAVQLAGSPALVLPSARIQAAQGSVSGSVALPPYSVTTIT